MKQVFAGLLFLVIGVESVSAQKEDSIGVDNSFIMVSQFKDSLRLNTNKTRLSPEIPDHWTLESYSRSFTGKQLTFRPDKAQKRTTVFNTPYIKFIIPAALISYGVFAREYDRLQELDRSTHDEVSEHFTDRIRLDDYTQFAPITAVYGLDLTGIKAKHNFRDRTFLTVSSYLLMSASVQTLKFATNIERQDGSNFHSFPSGHTATAFVGAHILFKEYKDTSPWIGITGYAVASGTGIMRIFNKKHWVSDVVTGAGVGILCVEISYLLLPVFHTVAGIKNSSEKLIVAPVAGNDNYGIALAYTF